MNEVQSAAAGMLGRGKTYSAVAKTVGVTERTLYRWIAKVPGMADEVERVRASSSKPEPRGVLLDALSARRDDGVDWNARVRAAQQLLALPSDESDEDEPGRVIVYAPPATAVSDA